MLNHPEGGYFVETYRSSTTVKNQKGEERPASTTIFYLLGENIFSSFHMLEEDEIWHHYDGGVCVIHIINQNDKSYSKIRLGRDDASVISAVVPKKVWFGVNMENKNDKFCLVGCTVAPGFVYEDFRLASRNDLLNEYSNHKDIIMKLTKEN